MQGRPGWETVSIFDGDPSFLFIGLSDCLGDIMKNLSEEVVFFLLKKHPDSTALELYNKLLLVMKQLSEKDQDIRNMMERFEDDGLVKHKIRERTALKEWRVKR